MPTGIEYCDETWEVGAGCENCWALRLIGGRLNGLQRHAGLVKIQNGKLAWTGEVRTFPDVLDQPQRWKKPRTIFVGSRFDLFHRHVPMRFLEQVCRVMNQCCKHTFLLLTKRPRNMALMLGDIGGLLPNNVWLGITAENQARLDERWAHLKDMPGNKWLSLEPLLGPVDVRPYVGMASLHCKCGYHATELDTMPLECVPPYRSYCLKCGGAVERGPTFGAVILGGESGPGARPMHPDWVRKVRDDCVAAGVPFFFKQWGEWFPKSQGGKFVADRRWGTLAYDGTFYPETTPWNGRQEDGEDRESTVFRVGKKAAGRLLDGREWNETPFGDSEEGEDDSGA